ncbi:syndetin-like [Zingiber officinale]|uniref:syndetin-like n=1 Tax=Zingiber officinale TaxID=94328 RepID=UPI001C4DC870|nr:syndetin-like [Zingiber officinale]
MRPDQAGNPPSFLDGDRAISEFETPGPLLFLPLLFIQGGGMDLSKVGEKIFSSVRSARSLGLLPSSSDRPEVPARAAAAAAIAHALAAIPPYQKVNRLSSSEESASIYNSKSIDDLEEEFYEEDFDPVGYVLENFPDEELDSTYFDKKSTLRLAQLDKISEQLSHHVMEHHEEMVKGMQLVTELEQDLKVANVICMNGRRHLTSSINEVSRDLVVNKMSRKKQALLDMIPILTELRRSIDMQMDLEVLVENGKYCQAFQLLPEYLQILDNYSELSVIQEMGHGVEAWLARTIQKLDSHLLGVCRAFEEESYVTAIDAYALMGDIAGLGEKIQSFFMQEVLSQTHSVLKDMISEEIGNPSLTSRLTYSDLCIQIPESQFRQCLLRTLDVLFRLMCSYYSIMSFHSQEKVLGSQKPDIDLKKSSTSHDLEGSIPDSMSIVPTHSIEHIDYAPMSSNQMDGIIVPNNVTTTSSDTMPQSSCSSTMERPTDLSEAGVATSACDSPFYQLRKDATAFVSHTLGKGRKNLWQLTSSRVSVLLSSSAICSTSTYQFLRNYEDLNIFILAGEAFCGTKAVEFRQKLKTTCESYLASFHRQNVYALKMILEKESWVKMSMNTLQVINLAGLVGDGAPLIAPSPGHASMSMLELKRTNDSVDSGKQNGFAYWLQMENPFYSKLTFGSKESPRSILSLNGSTSNLGQGRVGISHNDDISPKSYYNDQANGSSSVMEDENEDLLADFIDEDSQLPSRISKPIHNRTKSSTWSSEEISAQTGSSLYLLRLLDKYARLMQKLEIINVEFFKGICQLFGIFYHFIFETFGQPEASQSGKPIPDFLPSRIKTALSKIMQDCDQWIRTQNILHSISSPIPMSPTFAQMDVTPTAPPNTFFGHAPNTSFGLKERCSSVETISLVAQVLHKSKAHIHSMLSQHNACVIEEFFIHLVDAVPDLTEYIHRATARMLLHINGYADKIANAKWEVKELGFEHNGYVDLLLGEFKHYKTRLMHGGISKEVQDLLLEYGLENVAETLIEGLSRVKRCTDEGRVLMSLDLQVLINGLQHFVTINVKPKLQIVETFIKAYYLPETEYVHWARTHPEFSKSQITGLVNLVATMKGWKRKTRLEILERIEAGN